MCLSFSFQSVTLGIHFEPLILFEETGEGKKRKQPRLDINTASIFFRDRLDYLL